MRNLLLSVLTLIAIGLFSVSDVYADSEEFEIPDWVKNIAGLWYDDSIGDHTFLGAIEYLIKNEIIVIPTTDTKKDTSTGVPAWVKNNAGWWASDQIDDKTFVNGIQYLIQVGLIQVKMGSGGGGGGGY